MTGNPSYRPGILFNFFAGLFLVFLAASIITSLYWIAAIPFGLLFFCFGWRQPATVLFILIFFLPWSIEYGFNPSLATDLPDEPLMVLLAVLLVGQFLFTPSETSSAGKHPLIILLFIYLGWLLVTVLFSTDWLVSLKFLLAKGWYLAAFVFVPLLIFKNKRSIQTVGVIFLISMLCVALFALYRHAGFRFQFAYINNAVGPFFRNHVTYSGMLVCSVPVLIAVYQLNRKVRALAVAAMILVLAALLLSYARGAWVALLIGFISYWLIRKQKLFIAFAMGLILVLAAIFWVSRNDRYLAYANEYRTTVFHKNFEDHLIATYKLKDVSTAERFNRWAAGLRMIKDNSLTGYGPSTFYDNYKPYGIPVFKTWVSANKDRSTVHNYFLLTAIEQGIPGFLFFILLTGGMLYYSEKLYKEIRDRFYKVIVLASGVVLMMILTINFLSDLIETDKIGSLFFLCLAALVSADRNSRRIAVISRGYRQN